MMFLALLFSLQCSTTIPSHPVDTPRHGWQQYAAPAEAGWSEEKLAEVRKAAEEAGSAAFMVIHRGHVLLAWGDIERRFKCHSVRKSLLSALIGIHVKEGDFGLDLTMRELGIDDHQPLTEAEKEARVRDLLMSRSGIYHPAAKEPLGLEKRPPRGSHSPGSHWWYNNWDFNTLGVIFEQQTGTKIFEEFQKRIAEPLQMEDFRLSDTFYQFERQKTRHPAYAIRLSARDLARFGQLYLQKGRWNGKEIVPRAWVKESTKLHSRVTDSRGYGYMWWVYPGREPAPESQYPLLDPLDKFAAVGTGGQWVFVVPKAELVFVHRGDTDNRRHVPGRKIWALAEGVLAARDSEPKPDPRLTDVKAVPFPNPAPAPRERTMIALDPGVLRGYVGKYEIAPGVVCEVELYDDVLCCRSPDGEADFFPESETDFFTKVANVQLRFVKGSDGEVKELIIHLPGEEVRARKIE